MENNIKCATNNILGNNVVTKVSKPVNKSKQNSLLGDDVNTKVTNNNGKCTPILGDNVITIVGEENKVNSALNILGENVNTNNEDIVLAACTSEIACITDCLRNTCEDCDADLCLTDRLCRPDCGSDGACDCDGYCSCNTECSCNTQPCSCNTTPCYCNTNPCSCDGCDSCDSYDIPCSCDACDSCDDYTCTCDGCNVCDDYTIPCSDCSCDDYCYCDDYCSCNSLPTCSDCACNTNPCSTDDACSCNSYPCGCNTSPNTSTGYAYQYFAFTPYGQAEGSNSRYPINYLSDQENITIICSAITPSNSKNEFIMSSTTINGQKVYYTSVDKAKYISGGRNDYYGVNLLATIKIPGHKTYEGNILVLSISGASVSTAKTRYENKLKDGSLAYVKDLNLTTNQYLITQQSTSSWNNNTQYGSVKCEFTSSSNASASGMVYTAYNTDGTITVFPNFRIHCPFSLINVKKSRPGLTFNNDNYVSMDLSSFGEGAGSFNVDVGTYWESDEGVSYNIYNPDITLFTNYQCLGNGTNSGCEMYIDINGPIANFKVYISSYAEAGYDYVIISQLDQTIDRYTDCDDTTLVKAHTKYFDSSSFTYGDLSSYITVNYTNIPSGSHRITVLYRKDGSTDEFDDIGLLLIPKNQDLKDGSGLYFESLPSTSTTLAFKDENKILTLSEFKQLYPNMITNNVISVNDDNVCLSPSLSKTNIYAFGQALGETLGDGQLMKASKIVGMNTLTDVANLYGKAISTSSFSVDLNNQWRKSTAIPNPDSSTLAGVYESFSNSATTGDAIMTINIKGYETFTMYIRSYGENNYDYVMASVLDANISSLNFSQYSNSNVKAHTRGKRTTSTGLTAYTKVQYTGIDKGSHTIMVKYVKDASGDYGPDQGYLLIDNSGNEPPLDIYLTPRG